MEILKLECDSKYKHVKTEMTLKISTDDKIKAFGIANRQHIFLEQPQSTHNLKHLTKNLSRIGRKQ